MEHEYISFAYLLGQTEKRFLKHSFGYIEICSNQIELLYLVCFGSCIVDSLPENEKTVGEVTVLLEKSLYEMRMERESFNEDNPVSINSPMYVKGCNNKILYFRESEVMITHYPFQKISVFSKKTFSYTAIVGWQKDVVEEMKCGIKRCLSALYSSFGFLSFHAMCVSVGGKSKVFVASSRQGKSTLYANLISDGALHVSDDIVLSREENGTLFTIPVPVLPSIRKESINFLSEKVRLKKELVELDGINSEFLTLDGLEPINMSESQVDKFFILKKEKSKGCLSDTDIKKTLAKSMLWYMRDASYEELLSNINSLLSHNWGYFYLSPDCKKNIELFKKS